MKKKEKLHASFSVAPQTANFTAKAPDKVLMNVEKALNFWVEDMNRKRVPTFLHFIITLILVMSYCT
jgi:hypothetical protein